MDNETREFLERIADRLDAKLERTSKETVEEIRLFVREQVELSETRIITAFWNWSRPMEARMRVLDVSDAAAGERLTGLEGRMGELERRIGLGHTH